MTKEQALAWFRLGFEASGEGCNGEYYRGKDYLGSTAAWFEEQWLKPECNGCGDRGDSMGWYCQRCKKPSNET